MCYVVLCVDLVCSHRVRILFPLLLQHKHIVKTVNFSADCQKLMTGGSEKLLRIYDLGNLDADPYVLTGSPSQIRAAAFIDAAVGGGGAS